MELTPQQMRGIELILEQMDRFQSFVAITKTYRPNEPMDILVREFYEQSRPTDFEVNILNKVGLLLAPDSKEDLTMVYLLGGNNG